MHTSLDIMLEPVGVFIGELPGMRHGVVPHGPL